MMLFGSKAATGDVKWRGNLERALAAWDSVVEWGDYIVFLSRLEKAIKSKANDTIEMPLCAQVSEALARCLDPTLPAGVHQTAIQVYDSLFSSIPPHQVESKINIWVPGILPVVSYAAFNVKPKVIRLIETRVLQVSNLRELCRPLLLSLLPTMEDESSECYSDLVALTQKLRTNLQDEVLMWQCVAVCVISSPECRLGALNYFTQFLPSLEELGDESKPVLSPEPGIFLRAVSAALQDSNVFVQRGFLDVLVKNLPIHSAVFSSCPTEDFEQVLYAASKAILRKDMSLNRRLWAWLLGPDPELTESKRSRVSYFREFGAAALIKVLTNLLETKLSQVCLIVHGFMDRWELASSVVPELLVPIIKSAMTKPAEFEATSQLFDGVESSLIWKCSLDLIRSGDIATVNYIATHYNIKEEEMLTVHVPLMLVYCTSLAGEEGKGEGREVLGLVASLLAIVPPSSFSSLSAPPVAQDKAKIIEAVEEFYKNPDEAEPPFRESSASSEESSAATAIIASNLIELYEQEQTAARARLLTQFFKGLPSFSARVPLLVSKMLQADPESQLFVLVSPTMTHEERASWARSAVGYYFHQLATQLNCQVEVVRDLWAVHASAGQYLVPSALAQEFAQCEDPILRARAFSALWVQSIDQSGYDELLGKPTLLFLDMLFSDDTQELVVLFVKSSILGTNTTDKLLKILMARIKTTGARLEYMLSLLRKTVFGLGLKQIKRAFLGQYSKQFLEFFSELSVHQCSDACYSIGLSIIQSSVLDVEKLNVSALAAILENLILETSVSLPLLKFINTVLPHIPFDKRVQFEDSTLEFQLFQVLIKSIKQVKDEPTAAATLDFLETFLRLFNESVPQVVNPIATALIERLDELGGQRGDLGGLGGSNELVLVLVTCLEKLLLANFQYLYDAKGGHFTSFQEAASTEAATASKFIGNVISGVFTVESPSDRSAIKNGQVLLYEAIDMTVRKCCGYWETLEQLRQSTIGDAYSTSLYTMGRLKTRLRKLAAMLYKYQPMETIKLCTLYSSSLASAVRFVHMFEGTRYKHTIQVLLDNILVPQVREAGGASGVGEAGEVGSVQLFEFLNFYVQTLENDVIEDFWNIFMSFCSDVESKHQQYSSILFYAMRLLVLVAGKLDPQNKRLRKELGDHFVKIFGLCLDSTPQQLLTVVPDLSVVVPEQDKHNSLLGKLTGVVGDQLKGSSNWGELDLPLFELFAAVVDAASSPRAWRQQFSDMFFDVKFFTLSPEAAAVLAPVVEKWSQIDKERTQEFMSRVATFGSNSVLFGWSSSSALVDGNLKRLAYMALSCENLPLNVTSLVNQLSAIWNNKESVPAICILLRALALKFGQTQIFSFIGFRLQALFSDLSGVINQDTDLLSSAILVEATKLLDFCLTIEPAPFQMYEWLFICDNTDAIYPRHTPQQRTGDIIDKIASEREVRRFAGTRQLAVEHGKRKLLVPHNASVEDIAAFFSQASITLYEEMYGLGELDVDEMNRAVLSTIFD